jgi:preprotein translocase subunit SecA
MSESLRFKPGITLGSYPQKHEPDLTEFEARVAKFFARLNTRLKRRTHSLKYVARQVKRQQEDLLQCSEQELDEAIQRVRLELHREGLTRDLIFRAFAIIREAASRALDKSHYDVQLFGGWIMLNGMLAEMETGEGKTLTMTLPACTAALAGIPVHVITANDYLAARDCAMMLPLYQRLGLDGASVVDGMDMQPRQQAYRADIVHTTNQQVTFDYLRDRIETGDDTGPLRFEYRRLKRQLSTNQDPMLLRGLCFALVDEADSVLIDEANTPLIITRSLPDQEPADTYSDALYLASILFVDQDYTIDHRTRTIEITDEGSDNLANLVSNLPKQWQRQRQREALVTQALAATYFYLKDRQYMVDEGKVKIIDESTGRVMDGRAWEQGLHQMIEAKEGCIISEMREPQARISYQRFFSRYLRLGGTSGTISEVSSELHQVYGLDIVRVPTHRPCRRDMQGEKLFRDSEAQKQALVKRIAELKQAQRPVLIGTRTVEESEQVSAWLQQAGFDHRVLNARQDQHEAEIIADAGQPGTLTVATNMAGRGTDIALGPGVEQAGGLHVIAMARNGSRRVDRQLYGRCARQGDPGSAEAIVSLQDPALEHFYSSAMLSLLRRLASATSPLPSWISRWVLRYPQLRNEAEQARVRKLLMKQDQRLLRTLAFAGKFD